MKHKSFYLLISILLISMTLKSQSFNYGFKVGIGFSNITPTKLFPEVEIEDFYSLKESYSINTFIKYSNNDNFGILVEPGFIHKGARINHYNDEIKLNYLQLPILGDINITNKFYFSIGPEVGFLISDKSIKKDYEMVIIELKHIEFSGVAGISYCISNSFDIGVRYNHGISSSIKMDWKDEIGDLIGMSKNNNKYLQIILKYKM